MTVKNVEIDVNACVETAALIHDIHLMLGENPDPLRHSSSYYSCLPFYAIYGEIRNNVVLKKGK